MARCMRPSWTPSASEAERCRCSCAGESSEFSASPALLYAYNASKRMAEAHARRLRRRSRPRRTPCQPRTSRRRARTVVAPAPPSSMTRRRRIAKQELVVAQRAHRGAPQRRAARSTAANPGNRFREFAAAARSGSRKLRHVGSSYEGDFPMPEALRSRVISDCVSDFEPGGHEALRAEARFHVVDAVEPVEVGGTERRAVDHLRRRHRPPAGRRDPRSATRGWARAGSR